MSESLSESLSESFNAAPHGGDDLAITRGSKNLHVGVRELSREDSLALLANHHVGRIAISFHDRLRLKLCNYIYAEGWIYARAEMDDDLVIVRHHPWAAFEVDETEGIYDWRSVEAGGSIEFLSPEEKGRDWFEFENAVRLFRTVVPQILTSDDPMPRRTQLVRVHVDSILGRESRSSAPQSAPRP